jgi:hypothetical protein
MFRLVATSAGTYSVISRNIYGSPPLSYSRLILLSTPAHAEGRVRYLSVHTVAYLRSLFHRVQATLGLLNGASGLADEVDQRLASACMAYVQTVLWVGCRRTDVPLNEALVTFDEA